jgi:hypothetical protein
MSDKIENMENQQDEDKEKKRPVLFIPLIILGLLLLAGATYAVAATIASPEPTQEPTEAVQPTDEATEVVTEEATVSTEVPTEEPTEVVTDEPTEQPTEEVTPEPTEEEPTPTREPIPTREPPVPTQEMLCGNGICDPGETSTTCGPDCPVIPPDSFCSSACRPDGTCNNGLSCFNNVCWGPVCDPPPTSDPGDITCDCNDQYYECSDGSSRVTDACIKQNCFCAGSQGFYSTNAAESCGSFTFFCPDESSYEVDLSCNQADNLCFGTKEPNP